MAAVDGVKLSHDATAAFVQSTGNAFECTDDRAWQHGTPAIAIANIADVSVTQIKKKSKHKKPPPCTLEQASISWWPDCNVR